MPHIPSDCHIAENTQSLNSKQCIIFNICNKWTKYYMKPSSSKGNSKIDPIHLLLLVQVLGNHILSKPSIM